MTVGPPTERSFGFSVGGVCIVAAAWLWWRGRPLVSLVLLTVGIILVGLGVVAPATLCVLNRLWWRFAQAIGWVNARVLLTLFFVVVLTPVGAVRRLFGRDPLRAPRSDTNWSPYTPRRRDPKHYERLF